MKLSKNIFSVLTIVLAVISLAMFFMPFGQIIRADGSAVEGVGAGFAFGSVEGFDIYKSSKILFTLILSAFTVLFATLSLKYKGARWATIGFSIVDAVFMLVVALSSPNKFIDIQGMADAATAKYINMAPLLIAIALFSTFVSGSAYLLIADKLICLEAGEGTPTIPQKIVKFLRDYKGELKKIVWPNFRTVIKNTIIVLIMCALVGVFIFLIDFGLGALIDLIYGK